MPKLIVTQPEQTNEEVIEVGAEISIGRGPGNDVKIEGPGISRQHSKIFISEEQYFLMDLGSGNGTVLNGVSLQPNEKNLLRHNDLITIEPYHLRFWNHEGSWQATQEENEENTDSDILEVKLLKKVLDAIDTETVPSLEVLNGVAEGKRVFLTSDTEEITVGRDPNCDLPINEHVISRQHAKVVKRWGGVTLRDLDSKNGSYINNKRVVEEPLHDGDRIALGTIVLLYRNPQEVNIRELGEELAKKKKKKAAPPPSPSTPVEAVEQTPEENPEMETPPETEVSAANYPIPQPIQRLTSVEIGLIGLGVIVLAFAVITLVNLLMS